MSSLNALSRRIRQLFAADKKRKSQKRRAVARSLRMESLEERRVFVVGANAIPDAILPGSFYDGVVHLASDASSVPTDPRCSGSLLSTGRHILTAGHCVWQNETQTVSVGSATGGTFRLALNGVWTDNLAYNASAGTVESEIEEAFGENVSVSGGPDGNGNNPWSVEFRGNLKLTDVATMLGDGTNLVGGSVAINSQGTGASDGVARVGDVRFDLPERSITFDPGTFNPAEDFVHPNWNGLYFAGDNDDPAGSPGEDIAIITLPAIAPLGAQRYQPYTAQDETAEWQTFIVVGYGRTGTGATGEVSGPPDTAGTKRSAMNQFSDVHAGSGMLRSDFDDGTDDNNTLNDSLGLLPYEGAVARGDSGGPAFLNTIGPDALPILYVAGINSAVDAAGQAGFSAFGDRNYFTRVSDYTMHRDPLYDINDLISAPDDIVLDMNLQPVGNDGQADLIEVQTVNNVISININGSPLWSSPVASVLSLRIIGSSDDEVINAAATPFGIPLTIESGKGNDVITAGPGGDYIDGGPGNDQIQGMSGNDVIHGGDGIDDLQGQAGNDWIDGELGDDKISGGDGNDTLIGNEGSDLMYGGNGDDQMTGGVYSNTPVPVAVGPDQDILYGEVGNDYLRGDNFYVYSPVLTSSTGGNDELYGGPGYDTLDGQAGNDLMKGEAEPDTMYGGLGNDQMDGGDREDVMLGDAGNDVMNGAAGNDQITGGLGIDSIDGGDGNDQLIGGNAANGAADANADTIHGGLGNDLIAGDNATFLPLTINANVGTADTIFGDDGDDTIYGQGGGDTISGDNGVDVIYGGAGADQIQGGLGNDTISGDAGSDVVNGGEGNDVIFGGLDNDTLIGAGGSDVINGDDGNDAMIGGNLLAIAAGVFDLSGDTLNGGNGADVILGDNGSVLPLFLGIANGGNDVINGGVGNDLIYGFNGQDTIQGGDGDDVISGGGDDDTIGGDSGNDQVLGNDGNDVLRGGLGNDSVNGGNGDDIAMGETGDDSMNGEAGRDLLIGGVGADTINGGTGDDLLVGGTTTFDGNIVVLRQIFAEWRSPRTYSRRVQNIKGIANPEFANRLNGNAFFTKGATVFDDASIDTVLGQGDLDWFLYDPILDAIDAVLGEQLN